MRRPNNAERNNAKRHAAARPRARRLLAMYRSGLSLADVGLRHGITRQAVHQLIRRHFPDVRLRRRART